MTNSYKEIFEQKFNAQLSQKSLQNIQEIQNITGIRDNDALWLVLVALEYYNVVYQQIPNEIAESAQAIFSDLNKNLKEVSDNALRASLDNSHEYIAKAIENISNRSVYTVTKQAHLMIFFIAVFLIMLTTIVSLTCFGIGYKVGERSLSKKMYKSIYEQAKVEYTNGFHDGEEAGYKKTYDEKIAESWANSPAGRISYRFSNTSQYNNLIKCDLPGWFVKDGVCFPGKAKDGSQYGWQLLPP